MVTPADLERANEHRKTLQALQGFKFKWCRRAESNRRHEDFQSSALPTELPRHDHLKNGGGDGIRTRDLMRDRHVC